MDTVEVEVSAIKSTLDNVVRKLKRFSSRSMTNVWTIVRTKTDEIIYQLFFHHHLYPYIHNNNHQHIATYITTTIKSSTSI